MQRQELLTAKMHGADAYSVHGNTRLCSTHAPVMPPAQFHGTYAQFESGSCAGQRETLIMVDFHTYVLYVEVILCKIIIFCMPCGDTLLTNRSHCGCHLCKGSPISAATFCWRGFSLRFVTKMFHDRDDFVHDRVGFSRTRERNWRVRE